MKKIISLGLGIKAQSGTVFRLLVDGIIGLVIFALILSSLTYFESLRVSTSQAEFVSLIESAVETPNGKVVATGKDLVFLEGTGFSSSQIRNITGYSKECFTFQTNLTSGKISSDLRQITFLRNINSKVYAMCVTTGIFCGYNESGEDDGCCPIECIISFGKSIEEIEIE